jgi:hypothetical protein
MSAPVLLVAEIIVFLRLRYADAIARGDDATASRLRAQLDRLLNGPPS